MASPVLDFGAFSPDEQTAMLAAAKAELLVRMGTGRVRQGGSAAQQYGMELWSEDKLVTVINGLTAALGLSNVENRVRPNFNPVPASQYPAGFGY